MTRDMDIIRDILLICEAESQEQMDQAIRNSGEQLVYRHTKLAIEAGLIEADLYRGASGEYAGVRLRRLTWEGHNFLDAARDEAIWKKAKRIVIRTGASWTIEGLKLVLIDLATRIKS